MQQPAPVSYGKGANLDIRSHSWVFCYPTICDCQTPCCQGQVSVTTDTSLGVLTDGGEKLESLFYIGLELYSVACASELLR